MHLEHVILGFLSYMPLTGYDLKRSFDASIRHFWPVDQSQIYKTLTRLADQGFASVEVVHQESRPSRKIHSITSAGRAKLQEWIGLPPEPVAARDPFLIRVFFAGMLDDSGAIALLEAKAEQLRDLLDTYRAIADAPLTESQEQTPPRERFFWYLTLSSGLASRQAELDWLEHAIERIRGKEYEQGERAFREAGRARSGYR